MRAEYDVPELIQSAVDMAKPVQEWLVNNYSLNCAVLITPDSVRVLSDELYSPTELPELPDS